MKHIDKLLCDLFHDDSGMVCIRCRPELFLSSAEPPLVIYDEVADFVAGEVSSDDQPS